MRRRASYSVNASRRHGGVRMRGIRLAHDEDEEVANDATSHARDDDWLPADPVR